MRSTVYYMNDISFILIHPGPHAGESCYVVRGSDRHWDLLSDFRLAVMVRFLQQVRAVYICPVTAGRVRDQVDSPIYSHNGMNTAVAAPPIKGGLLAFLLLVAHYFHHFDQHVHAYPIKCVGDSSVEGWT